MWPSARRGRGIEVASSPNTWRSAPRSQSGDVAREDGRRRPHNRERILAAARNLFAINGYSPVSVEDIAAAAGLSRMTVYRYFNGKPALAVELFEGAAAVTIPIYLGIAERNYRELSAVREWIVAVFAADRASRQILRIFTQANLSEPTFTRRSETFISELISRLGRAIPAFAIDRADPDQREKWLEAWLLINELLGQSYRSAWDNWVASDPIMIDILARRFFEFVNPNNC